jgi:protein-L-isoaspartate(D-aspartate) O-methyltransferase
MELADCRELYADGLRYAVNMRSDALWRAFATVPRERFLGPGPWLLQGAALGMHDYRPSPNADPRHVYHDVLVALDSSRRLNNGQPSAWARWLDSVDPQPGQKVVHVGCGSGYYSAILAEMVGPKGSVLGYEVDAALAQSAKANLSPWPQASAVNADGAASALNDCDLIVVSAGVTRLPLTWMTGLAPGGHLLVPLTVHSYDVVQGRMLRVTRIDAGYGASIISYAGFYPCVGTQHAGSGEALSAAFRKGLGFDVKSLRLDVHDPAATCWLHDEHYCLSTVPVTNTHE